MLFCLPMNNSVLLKFKPKCVGILHFLKDTSSTNQWLQTNLDHGKAVAGDAVYALNQTQGRGQKGNQWFSEPEKNLLFSLSFVPDKLNVRNQFILSQRIALTVSYFLDKILPGTRIKWPNDIYFQSHKLGGILIENQLRGTEIALSIIGIGLNINQEDFPKELSNPVSIFQIQGVKYDLHEIATEFHYFLTCKLKELEFLPEDLVCEKYRERLYRKEGFHPYKDQQGVFNASIEGFTSQGHLILKSESGEIRNYDLKEVTFLPEHFSH
jgi:BirA family transcriptional regulator, biotin operon repressor / biotin---[acetyl-CoA-carboxylase] ligase